MSNTNGPAYTSSDVLDFIQQWTEQDRRLKVEKEILQNIEKRAKNRGLPVKVIRAESKLQDLDAEAAHEFIRDRARVSVILNGPQLDLVSLLRGDFLSAEDKLQAAKNQAEDLGFRAGRAGVARENNPYRDDQPQGREIWDLWWLKGVEEENRVTRALGDEGVAVEASREQPAARRRKQPEPTPAAAEIEKAVMDEFVQVGGLDAEPEEQPAVEEVEMPWNPEPRTTGVARRGRPKGSKNKPKDQPQKSVIIRLPPKKRGRPPGSKNKPKVLVG